MTYFWFIVALALGIPLLISRRKLRAFEASSAREREAHNTSIKSIKENHRREISRLLDAIPDPFFSIDSAGKLLRCNHAASAHFRGRNILDRSYQQVFIDAALCQLIKRSREIGRDEVATIRFPSKSPFSTHAGGQMSVWEVEIRSHSIRRDAHEHQLMMRDITAASHADQIRQDFVANASHELRTPLSIIVGYLEALMEPDSFDNPTLGKKMLSTMNRHVERINRIVEDMLVISRLESSDKIPLTIEPFSLNDCVRDVVERLELVIESQNANVTIDVPGIQMKGDSFYWTQILFNLVENALKQNTSQRVAVTIAAKKIANNEIEITVTDNGIGIPNADLPFIFKRFFRVEKHHGQNAVKGTGLGLSIVKRAIEAHKGKISATSVPGQETTFRIVVPS
jgi:two-component system phosphate regulon sensor histidine kinase PhoR